MREQTRVMVEIKRSPGQVKLQTLHDSLLTNRGGSCRRYRILGRKNHDRTDEKKKSSKNRVSRGKQLVGVEKGLSQQRIRRGIHRRRSEAEGRRRAK